MKDNVFTSDTQTFETDYENERNKPVPSHNHGSIQTNISFLIKLNYGKKYRAISELSLNLSDWISVPDIAIIPYKKLNTKEDIIKFSEAPLCAIEILSPTQSLTDLLVKANGYFEHGVKSCWIVLPGVDNIYVFSTPDDYQIFKKGEILKDEIIGVELEITEAFD